MSRPPSTAARRKREAKTTKAAAPAIPTGAARLLSDWSVEHCAKQAFQAPEQRDHIHLVGHVPGGLPGINRHIITSRIVKAEGRLVTTKSGSVYELGAPSPDYLAWLAERGMVLDEAQPVKVPG